MLGDLLGNSYFALRMGARNDGAWKRFITALKAADMGKAAGVTKETQKYLSGLYKAYVKAVDAAGSGVKVSSIVDEEEKEKAAEKESERKSKKSTTNTNSLYTSTYEFVQKVDPKDRSSFSRSLANKTANLANREIKTITIYGATKNGITRVYYFVADGYMQGRMSDVVMVSDDWESKRRRYKDGIDSDTQIANIWTDPVSFIRGDANGGFSRDGEGRGSNTNDSVSEKESRGNRTGSSGRSVSPSRVDLKEVEEVVKKLVEIYNISEADLEEAKRKRLENERRSKKKAYRRAEASATLEEAVAEHLVFSDAYGKLKGQSKKEATEKLWKAFNTAESDEAQRRAALDVADFVLDNAVVEAFGEDPNAEYYAEQLSVLKGYLRTLNLDGIKEEIRNRFGKDTSPYLLWGKREGKAGVAPDLIKSELIEQGIVITENSPAEIFFEIYETQKR